MTAAGDTSRDGTIEPTADGYVVRFVRRLEYPASVVWDALADPDARGAWFFPGRLEPTPGGMVELTDSAHGIRGRVLVAEPGRVLEFTWDSADAPAETVVRFELTPTPHGCVLTFSHRAGANANPDRLAAGWHSLLDALPRHLAGHETDAGDQQTAESWADHFARYRGYRLTGRQIGKS